MKLNVVSLLDQLKVLANRSPVYVAASAAQLIEDVRDSQRRPDVALWGLCATVEAITRFLASVAIADLAAKHEGRLPKPVRNALAERIEQPTFAVWALAFREVVAASKQPPAVAPELATSATALERFMRPNGARDKSFDSNLIELRNALAHAAGAISHDLAARLLDIWLLRSAEIVHRLAWMSELSLWTFDSGEGWLRLNGPGPDGVPDSVPSVVADRAEPGAAVLQRGDDALSLRPLGRRGQASRAPKPQIYVRRGLVSLAYSLVGDERMLQTEGPKDLIPDFERLFDLEGYRAALREKGFSDLGFDAEVAKAARGFIGRADAVDSLWQRVIETLEGVLSLTGVAGVGKSAFMGKIADDVRKEAAERRNHGERWFVFIHRFNADDGRCAPLPFLRALYERLAAALESPLDRTLNEQARILDRVIELLANHPLDRVVLFLDGLDELARKEATFVERALPRLTKAARRTLFVIAHRPEAGLPKLMRDLGAQPALEQGAMQPFNEAECRAFIANHLPEAVRLLIGADVASDEGSRNAFVNELTKRSGGLPQYLVLVRQDIAAGHYRKLTEADAAGLPRSVEAYFQELLERSGVGDVMRVRPLIVAYLAETKAPLTVSEVEALVAREDRRGRRPSEGVVALALATLGGVLRAAYSVSGEPAYELFHVDFRDFVRSSPLIRDTRQKARDVLLEGAHAPGDDEAQRYFFRWGIEHLVDADLAMDAVNLLSDFDYQLGRLKTLAPEGGDALIRQTWVFVVSKLANPGALSEEAFAWHQFWATDGGLFEPGEGRDAARELVERALEYAPDTVVGRAATPFLREPRSGSASKPHPARK